MFLGAPTSVRAETGTSRSGRLQTQVGVKLDGVPLDGTVPQDTFPPVIQAIQKSIEHRADREPTRCSIYLLKEAQVQGVNTVKVWDCNNACYARRSSRRAGPRQGEYLRIGFLPLEEAKYTPVMANFEVLGKENADGNGEQAWALGLLLRDAVNAA